MGTKYMNQVRDRVKSHKPRRKPIVDKIHRPTSEKPSPLKTQVGGNHYKGLQIQPVEYIQKNKIPFMEGSAIKYLTRWRDKGGIEDLKKAKHFIDMLIEFEE